MFIIIYCDLGLFVTISLFINQTTKIFEKKKKPFYLIFPGSSLINLITDLLIIKTSQIRLLCGFSYPWAFF